MTALALIAALALALQGESKPIVVHAKRAHTLAGGVVEDGAVVIQGGKIAAVGRGVSEPSDAETIEGVVVTPGLVDANVSAGLRGIGVEDFEEVTPAFRAIDNLDTASPDFARLASQGVTTAFVAPENRNVVGGLAAIVKTAPSTGPRVLNPEASMKAAFGFRPTLGNFTPRFGLPANFHVRRPSGRPATAMEMRLAFFEAERAKREGRALDPGQARLVEVLEKKLPLRVNARTVGDLRTALRFGAEFGLPLTIDEAAEAHRLLPQLKAAGAKLVIGPTPVDPLGTRWVFSPDSRLEEKPCLNLLTAVVDAGIPVALSAHGAPVEDDLIAQARAAVRYGATREAALRAVTRSAAEILGVTDRVGTLEAGRDAD
ncbi:MAG TPA: hypothetical protein VKE69_10195, partial [Planctomycetota bacterium]|nr:hypothetical protein [Planctomycetota bacterium]